MNLFLADFKYIILWWLTAVFTSLFFLPATFKIFNKFYDKGYLFAKTFASFGITFIVLITGIFEIIPFTKAGLWWIFGLLTLVNLLLFKIGYFKEFFKTLSSHYRIFIFQETIYLIILIFWSYVRGHAPDIEGLEKYMDFGFVNSALKTTFMPPKDIWFGGLPINYYYFGHLVVAVLTKLSGISSALTYNLAIASICAATFSQTFSLAGNLIYCLKPKSLKPLIIGGLISALLLTFGGNLHWLYKSIKLGSYQNYWYPDATRFIGFDPDTTDKTIHEFPLYSFVVSDLHGHLNDIPMVLFFLAVLLVFYYYLPQINLFLKTAFLGWILSCCYMTNAWDFAVYGLVFGFVCLLFTSSIFQTFKNGILVVLFWYLFTLPFSLNFIPMAEGLKISDGHTPFYQLFILYGGFWLIAAPFILFIIKKKKPLDLFILAIIISATLLIIIPEIIYIKDIYIYDHRRANTMFKLVYQAFILYSLVSGVIFYRLITGLKSKILVVFYRLLFSFVFLIHLIYPVFAINSFYGGLKKYHGLNGQSYLQKIYPDNFLAIEWLKNNVNYQPVIVEAVGDSYTTYGQVSVATGFPTIQGWVVHEWLWRGGYDKPAERQAEVEKIYLSQNLAEAKSLLQKYAVSYIFVGAKEYEKYPTLDPSRFEKIGAKKVYQNNTVSIYQL